MVGVCRFCRALALAALAAALGCAIEVGLRAVHGLPLLPDRNLLAERIDLLTHHTNNRYDPLLGWVVKPGLAADQANPHNSLTTGPLGERRHSAAPLGSADAIVAVGDSFTWGSEVGDRETWPAALEVLLGRPVINGATGGWGADQIVLRAEQLRDLLHPAATVVSLLYDDIDRAGFRLYGGGAKPWFTLEAGMVRLAGTDTVYDARHIVPHGLVLHGVPVPSHVARDAGGLGLARSVLGWSHVADALAMRLDARRWMLGGGYARADTDPAAVTCALLERLRPRLLVLQWGAGQVLGWTARPADARRVLDCARDAGIATLDLWDALKAHSAEALAALYVRQRDGSLGHMSAAGNAVVAGLIGRALARPAAAAAQGAGMLSK